MDIVTLGAALKGATEQTKSYVNGHFIEGTNIKIDTNPDGTQTISATGDISAEDEYARAAIADHVADDNNPHGVTASQVGLENVDNTSDLDKPVSTATQTALSNKVDKITGKGLSTNDFTTAEKSKLDGIETGAEVNVQSDWEQSDTTADDYVKNKPTIPTVNNATITIQKNGTTVDSFTANQAGNKTINITVPVTAADVSALPASTKYGSSITASINSTTYVMTITLKDQNGSTLGTAQTIDLPLETMVVGGSYDSTNKKVVLTLKNGNTVEFSVADLVAGLQTEITAQNKLSADLVDDTNATHKFVTTSEKTTWNGKQDTLTFDNSPASGSNNPVKSGGIYTALADKVDKVTGKGLSTNDYTTAEKTKLGKAITTDEIAIQSNYFVLNGVRVYISATEPTGTIPDGSIWIGG